MVSEESRCVEHFGKNLESDCERQRELKWKGSIEEDDKKVNVEGYFCSVYNHRTQLNETNGI